VSSRTPCSQGRMPTCMWPSREICSVLLCEDATALDSARFDVAALPPDPWRLVFAVSGGIPAVMPSCRVSISGQTAAPSHGNACEDSELSRYPQCEPRAIPHCREHLRTQRTQTGAGDTRACMPGTRARAPAPTERTASHAPSLTDRPQTRADPARVGINLFQITLSRRSSTNTKYHTKTPQSV